MIFPHPEYWQPLVDALRAEVQEYAWLLKLLDQQQSHVLERTYGDLPGLTTDIGTQVTSLEARRNVRLSLQAELLREAGLASELRLRELLQSLEPPTDGLFAELIHELERLANKLTSRSRQNSLLLARAHEVSREMCRRLRPHSLTDTYSNRGQRPTHAAVNRPAALAVRA